MIDKTFRGGAWRWPPLMLKWRWLPLMLKRVRHNLL